MLGFPPSRFDPDMNIYGKWDVLDCLTPLRLSEIRPHPLFWSIKSDSIIMLDILPYDLHLNTRITTHKPPISALWLDSSSPPLNLGCAPCMPSNVDTTHYYDSAFTWKLTHKICTLCLWTRCMLSRSTPSAPRLEVKLLNATRHVKCFCKFMNPPKYGSHACLEGSKGLCLQINS